MSETKNPMIDLPDPNESLVGIATRRFRISTGLKRVLGRELITNDEVAIFELVKNSFDAGASQVYLQFETDSITIADDGCGMSDEDLNTKWLFVAYSSKRLTKRSDSNDFRDQADDRRHYAGSKGIGRFSSDRLGRFLTLQTRTDSPTNDNVQVISIDWSKFEADDQNQFVHVDLDYRQSLDFDLPPEIPNRSRGTVIQITGLTKTWSRDDLLRLRSGLAKLINPFGAAVDGFDIHIIAENEKATDQATIEKAIRRDPDLTKESVPTVNGRIGNFIFSTLKQKTTFLTVRVDALTNSIETTLTDRGEIIYRIREPNKFDLLKDTEFRCELYSLNRAAKATFARRMGIPSVQFGSVFLFRNGFRVFPVGESGDDWFGIDRRKQQGFGRYLGTRDVIQGDSKVG